MTTGHSASSARLALEDAPLDALFAEVRRHILDRQHPVTGLLPASTAVTAHGDYTDAWVRDNVYSILAPWSLAIACRRAGQTTRAFELDQAVVRNMRGLMLAMMRQSDRIERFKHSLDPVDALHAKYDTTTGGAVVGDEEWGHLQLDATSLFVLMLVQMTAGGLTIVQSRDEVDFVQNLVWYLSRAYVTPDYGIWERGNKINIGVRELNASSLGMVLAALEAADGFDLFGDQGDEATHLQVVPDDLVRVTQCLEAILPRESASKEIDSALLAVIGYPAFAVPQAERAAEVSDRIETRLAGRYGYKRFLRDGHQTVVEDENKLHYEPEELEAFARIECEWPLFTAYRLINACFAGDHADATAQARRLGALAVCENAQPALPELYYVPPESIDAEREHPGSSRRLANANRPLVWAQSLWVVGRLLLSGQITPTDIDPLGRHARGVADHPAPVGVALLAESEEARTRLAESGVGPVERLDQVTPAAIPADVLIERLASTGRNVRLGLGGRPRRRVLELTTAAVIDTDEASHVLVPAMFDTRMFLLGRDVRLLIHEIRTAIGYLSRRARGAGRPLFVVPVADWMLAGSDGEAFLAFCRDELASGDVDGIPVWRGSLATLAAAAPRRRLSGGLPAISPPEPLPEGEWRLEGDVATLDRDLGENPTVESLLVAFARADALDERLAVLERLGRSDLPDEQPFVDADGVDRVLKGHRAVVFAIAQRLGAWRAMRQAAEMAGVVDAFLEVAMMDLIVQQKRVAVGLSYTREAVIDAPISNREILARIAAYCGDDWRERALTQELVIHLGAWLRAEPALFDDVITVRTGPLLQIMVALLAREGCIDPSRALDQLVAMPPHRVRRRLRQAMTWRGHTGRLEALHRQDQGDASLARVHAHRIDTLPGDLGETGEPERRLDWYLRREIEGAMSRLPEKFYRGVWAFLGHVPALVVGNRFDARSVIDSQLYRGQYTAGEHNFALAVEHRLNRIEAPEYRQLTIEALATLSEIVAGTPDLSIAEPLVLDVLIGHAVRLAWLDGHPEDEGRYDERRADAWEAFYRLPPETVAECVTAALDYLLQVDVESRHEEETVGS
ncbi:MAG: hypothetical protein JXJ30_06170 [Halothiobacillaceae bacterium]|nr:hypothetical protein [Halothiobacillaceae bacterium]